MKVKAFVSLFILLLFYSSYAFSEDIPQELQKLGFTEYTLVDYKKAGDTEYFTFSDWRTEQINDTITFVVEKGKIKSWFKKNLDDRTERNTI